MSGQIILVVDDDLEIQSMLRRGLTVAGYRPVFCRSGARAPRHVRRLRPDAVVLDVVLGRSLNGFQICAILKQEPATRNIPVLMTSGVMPDREFAREAVRRGAAGYVRKSELWPEIRLRLDMLLRPDRALGESGQHSGEANPAGTVLVVDDQEEWLALAQRLLQDSGHRVVVTPDESAVVDLAVRHRPECIVLDYQLRRGTAAEVCRQLQSTSATRGIPVVILTGDPTSRKRCLDCGADQCVMKDAPIEELTHVVARSIRRYRWSSGILVQEDLRLDRRDGSVSRNGRLVVNLASNRFEFLHALVQRCPEYVTRRELASVLSHGGDYKEYSKALDKLAARTKEDLGKPLGDRIHQLKDLGWVYELRMPEPSQSDTPGD
jgi:DNA-binding response OmpR family regulator